MTETTCTSQRKEMVRDTLAVVVLGELAKAAYLSDLKLVEIQAKLSLRCLTAYKGADLGCRVRC